MADDNNIDGHSGDTLSLGMCTCQGLGLALFTHRLLPSSGLKGRDSRGEQRWDSVVYKLVTWIVLLNLGSLKNSLLFIHLINLQSGQGSVE